MQKNLTKQSLAVAQIGAEIGLELGDKMVKSYREKNPTKQSAYEIGRDILDAILAQPGCQGIKFYDAYNEIGEKTLVYVGLDHEGKTITSITVVDNEGKISAEKGIVADRIRLPGQKGVEGIADDDGGWGWSVD